ncbi:MAG: hypothetical protein HWN69_09695 [Desulfobacterales bacterium]|nr:hypothetical protein [Desulfobacterales bacterium]
MTLKLELQVEEISHPEIHDPDSNAIVSALREIDNTDDSFVILSYSEMDYMQTDGYSLEYQEGDVEAHFYSPSGFQSPEYAAQFFLSYANPNSNWWRKSTQWIKGFAP